MDRQEKFIFSNHSIIPKQYLQMKTINSFHEYHRDLINYTIARILNLENWQTKSSYCSRWSIDYELQVYNYVDNNFIEI